MYERVSAEEREVDWHQENNLQDETHAIHGGALPLITPEGFKAYAYGFVFFAGNYQGNNTGFITVLLGNPYHTKHTLFADLNNNNNFTDDNYSVILPWRGDTAEIEMCISGTKLCTKIKFTRHLMENKQMYKQLMNAK